MALVQGDRVLETTTTTGTGTLTLGGAVTGYRAFSAVCSNNDTCFYSVWAVDSAGQPTGQWETGLGTWATGGTLARTKLHASSTGSAINFSAGTKRVALASIAGFGWRDITSNVEVRGVGAADPSFNVFRTNIRAYQFTVNDECWFVFHMPHDWAPGTDIFIHAHWAHASATVASGAATWGFDVTWAKGFNQAAYPATVNTTVAQNASTTQYQHMVAEVQLTAASPSASQIDTDILEADGLFLVRCYLAANTINGTPEPFLFTVDLHYQSTSRGTINKAPDFYVT